MTEQDSAQMLPDVEVAWELFEEGLATYLACMRHQGDHLIVEAPDGGEEEGTAPYAQFAVFGPDAIRAELSGNTVLREEHRLPDDVAESLVEHGGWEAPRVDQGFTNYAVECDLDSVGAVAAMVRFALADVFAIPDPGLLSYRAWGPASEHAELLGLLSSEEIAVEAGGASLAVMPRDHDHLVELVEGVLAEVFDEPVEQDDDEDFVIEAGRSRAYVRVRRDQPTIEVFALVVCEVRNQRQAAVEVGLLNRDTVWTKYVLRGRAVLQTVCVPAAPFVAEHLASVVPMFLGELESVRDDLALRTGGRA
jgi:hypothetical protein